MGSASDFIIENGVLTKYTGLDGDVTIPEGVVVIGHSAFEYYSKIKRVIVPYGVTKIEEKAFSYCSSLKHIDLPATVTSIGESAFGHCSDLKSVVIPNSVTSIGDRAFEHCESLLQITLPNSVVDMGDCTFFNCTDLKHVVLPNGITQIGYNMFGLCSSLESIEIPVTVTSIGERAFSSCNALTHITIPEGVVSIGCDAFNFCSKLEEVKLPLSLVELGNDQVRYLDGVFENCGIVEIVIPEGVTKITKKAFASCKELKRVHLPSTLREIAEDAFLGCTSLAFIDIPDGVKTIGEDVFRHCHNLKWTAVKTAIADFEKEEYRNRIGFGDENGCVVRDGVLIKYVGPSDRIVITEGVKIIPKNAMHCKMESYGRKSYQFPESLQRLEEQSWILYSDEEANLPTRYLQTREKLPAKYTAELLEGPWKNKAQLKDYAALMLFQSAKEMLRICEPILKRKPSESVNCFLEILNEGCKSADILKVTEFILENKKLITSEAITGVYDIAVSKKAKKAASLLEGLVEKCVPEQKKTAVETAIPAKTDPCAPFREIFDEYLLNKTFRKYITQHSECAFSEVKLRGGQNAPMFLVKCALVPYLEQLAERPKKIGDYKTDYIPVKFVPKADEAAAMLDTQSLQAALETVYRGYNGTMLLPAYCRYASNAQIAALISDMNKWRDWSVYNAAGRRDIIIARGALMLSDKREAMMYMDKCGCLGSYAKLRNTTPDIIRDQVLSDVGLDLKGEKTYHLGNQVVTVQLQKDLSFLVVLENGKTAKSIPKKDAEPETYTSVTADFSELKKNVKKITKNRTALLLEEFLSGRERSAASWKAAYLSNPILRTIASLLVWAQGNETFTILDNGAVKADGSAYTIDDNACIAPAHPMDMRPEDLKAWQTYFAASGLKQPFEQIWEPVITQSDIKSDRYKGCMIPYYRFVGQQNRGIRVTDVDFHNEIDIRFEECDADVERIDWQRHAIDMNDRFEITSFSIKRYSRKTNHLIAYIDRITMYDRILRNDITISDFLPQFTLAQIIEFINLATENNCANVTAILLEYKHKNYADINPLEEFVL